MKKIGLIIALLIFTSYLVTPSLLVYAGYGFKTNTFVIAEEEHHSSITIIHEKDLRKKFSITDFIKPGLLLRKLSGILSTICVVFFITTRFYLPFQFLPNDNLPYNKM